MTKVTIFSGFLGAGKTTLIKKLIKELYKGEKLVLIENEFGEIGIDGGFMQDAGVEVAEINSGCICCSLVGDFGKALEKVIQDYAPERILIEPSGVGKLSDVIKAVKNVNCIDKIELDGYIAVADASKCKVYIKNFGEFYKDQIQSASAILLSRTKHMDDAKLTAAITLLRELNSAAPIVTTPWDELPSAELKDVLAGNTTALEDIDEHEHHHDEHCSCHEHHGEHEHHDEHCNCHEHHHADDVFTSWGKETPRKYSETEIDAILKALDSGNYGKVLRAKGIVPTANGTWLHYDYVPEEINIRTGAASYTGRICVIGAELEETKLCELFGI
ncbi:MAG: GTP-binding protein [Oscillospiraceae bacterium]